MSELQQSAAGRRIYAWHRCGYDDLVLAPGAAPQYIGEERKGALCALDK